MMAGLAVHSAATVSISPGARSNRRSSVSHAEGERLATAHWSPGNHALGRPACGFRVRFQVRFNICGVDSNNFKRTGFCLKSVSWLTVDDSKELVPSTTQRVELGASAFDGFGDGGVPCEGQVSTGIQTFDGADYGVL